MFMQFEDGTIVKCVFDSNFTTRVEVSAVFGGQKSHFAPNSKSDSVYMVTHDLRFRKLMPNVETDVGDLNPTTHFRPISPTLHLPDESTATISPTKKRGDQNFRGVNNSKSIYDQNFS